MPNAKYNSVKEKENTESKIREEINKTIADTIEQTKFTQSSVANLSDVLNEAIAKKEKVGIFYEPRLHGLMKITQNAWNDGIIAYTKVLKASEKAVEIDDLQLAANAKKIYEEAKTAAESAAEMIGDTHNRIHLEVEELIASAKKLNPRLSIFTSPADEVKPTDDDCELSPELNSSPSM